MLRVVHGFGSFEPDHTGWPKTKVRKIWEKRA